MCTHFPTVDTVDLTHGFLDERMAGFALYRLATVLRNQFDRIPGQARIIDNTFAGILLQQLRPQQSDNVIAFDIAAVMIEQKAAVKITVPG